METTFHSKAAWEWREDDGEEGGGEWPEWLDAPEGGAEQEQG
jgi:hypothetical protein